MALLDLGTRKFWRAVGREVDLAGSDAWLRAPMSSGPTVRDDWLAEKAPRHGGVVQEGTVGAGLLASMADLDGPGFTAADLAPEVRDFYEHTSGWRMDVWTGWAPWFWPGGELVSRLFGRRVEQLSLPMRPLDVAQGMDSRISLILDAAGRQVGAGWLRTLRATGAYVYSGAYSSRVLPGADRPSIHVAFPLESGNVQVFLRPSAGPDGSLTLSSPPGRFGADGAYVVVADGGRTFASRVPIHETFRVYVDPYGVLRTDHDLRVWDASAAPAGWTPTPARRRRRPSPRPHPKTRHLEVASTVFAVWESVSPHVDWVIVVSACLHVPFYVFVGYALMRYLYADEEVTRDELFATAAAFTVVAWAFAYAYAAVQVVWPGSFGDERPWFDLLFLSFTTMTNTGLGDFAPITAHARSLVALQEGLALFYIGFVVSRLVGLATRRRDDAN